ncbi:MULTISPECIES: hypothetical protein [unclassified Moorena]|uniref:hypothetical protein n=1 Tax=unclassified Moorena TaxID=2683338 RepID=UPI0013BED609|nr:MULTISPECIES: hypothetical protein [unclassified Moorena]NEP31710.1 hypothetical protein [Moorena sp. SIO3B2]NEQ15782.1 hypothetical protein [Moorena sp. SIO3E2]
MIRITAQSSIDPGPVSLVFICGVTLRSYRLAKLSSDDYLSEEAAGQGAIFVLRSEETWRHQCR